MYEGELGLGDGGGRGGRGGTVRRIPQSKPVSDTVPQLKLQERTMHADLTAR